MVHALTIWKHYLLDTTLVVKTDHQSLKYFFTQKKLSPMQMRWVNFLSMFHFTVESMKGKDNLVVDALSRRLEVGAIIIRYHTNFTVMRDLYAIDTDFSQVWHCLQQGNIRTAFSIREGFLMMQDQLCTESWRNVMHLLLEDTGEFFQPHK